MANFLSNAFLSIFMDKKARETLERRKGKAAPESKKKVKAKGKGKTKSKNKSKGKAAANRPPARQPEPTLSPEDAAERLAQKIASAETAIAQRSEMRGELSGERGELIFKALQIQKAKADVFKDIDEEQFRKLQGLAQKMMLGGRPEDR